MSKQLTLILGISLLCFSPSFQFTDEPIAFAKTNKPVPEYAKWGRLAMVEAKKKYPNAQFIDYLHMGREKKDDTTTERFKLWIRENKKEFGIFITITFDTKTEEVKNVQIIETPR